MKIPEWVQQVLTTFDQKTDAHSELQIVDALDRAKKPQGDLSDEDFKGYIAERSAFLFRQHPEHDSPWNTFFGPIATLTKDDGTEVRIPDVSELSADTVAHWEHRSQTVKDPVMRARYADLVCDLKKVIAKARPSHTYAQLAIDAYIDATQQAQYTMDMEAVGWLNRALSLSLSISDKQRTGRVINAMFEYYDKILDPHKIGAWIFPFDTLYDKKDLLTTDQQDRIIADLETMLQRTSANGKPEEFDPYGAQAAAERLARHYNGKKDKANVHRVIKTYGEAFEKLAKEASPMLAVSWLQPVIERYEQEGMKEEAERLQMMSAEKGNNIAADMKQIAVKVELKQEDIEKLIDDLTADDLRTSLLRIADYFVPKAEDAKKLLKTMQIETPLLARIPTVRVAADGHTTAKIGSIDDDAEGRLHEQLGRIMSFYQPILTLTLEKLTDRYQPSVDQILKFLSESPLFAASRTELLREGLVAYTQKDFMKAIHVLVPEIEHLLRSFLPLLGIPPLKTVPRHPGIMDAKSMNDVLSDERVQQVLTENLWRYLAVVYIDRKGGLNLRNDLAHGLLNPKALNQHTANRVLHSLLALSLIRQQEENAAEEEATP
jgi:lysyl-tRNA synthetase class 1